jgi:hypothetical protein
MSLAPVVNGRQQPPPKYCLVPNEVKDQIPSATAQLFIQPPPFADQAASAYTWATNNGFAILPQNPCTPEMLMYTGQQQGQGITAFISSPQAGQQFVQGMVQVTGTAMFPQGGGTYFKMEIIGPQFPNWVTFGSTHTDPVANGVLDSFGADISHPHYGNWSRWERDGDESRSSGNPRTIESVSTQQNKMPSVVVYWRHYLIIVCDNWIRVVRKLDAE